MSARYFGCRGLPAISPVLHALVRCAFWLLFGKPPPDSAHQLRDHICTQNPYDRFGTSGRRQVVGNSQSGGVPRVWVERTCVTRAHATPGSPGEARSIFHRFPRAPPAVQPILLFCCLYSLVSVKVRQSISNGPRRRQQQDSQEPTSHNQRTCEIHPRPGPFHPGNLRFPFFIWCPGPCS